MILTKYLNENKICRKDFAAKIGIDRTTLWLIEKRGAKRIDSAIKIARLTNFMCSIDDLLFPNGLPDEE